MKRRGFLLLGAGLAAFAAVLGAGGLATEAEIASLVRRRLAFLRLDEAGLRAYARDQVGRYLAKRPTWARIRLHFLTSVSPSFHRFLYTTDKRSRMERLADAYATEYLLSSDLFAHGDDESRVVHYLGFYDPISRPCGNPFARPVESS